MSVNFVFVIAFCNRLAVLASRVLLTPLALDLGAQPFAIGLLATTFAVFPMLLSYLSGTLFDRFGSRLPLMFGSAVGGLAMLVPYFFSGLPAIFVAAAINGISVTFLFVCTQTLVGLISEPQKRAANFSNYSVIGTVASFLAPVLIGFAIDHSGYAVSLLYIVALSFAPVVPLAIWGGRLPGGRSDDAPAGSIRDLLSDPGVRKVLFATSLMNTGQDLYMFYTPVYAHAIGLSASTIGIVLAMNAAAAFAVRLILPRMVARFKEEKLITWSFYVGAASLMLIPLFESATMLALISFVFGLGTGLAQPIITMLMFSNSAKGRSGEAMGLRMSVVHLTRLVGPLAFGAIASGFGLLSMFWVNGLMMGCGGIISRTRNRA